MKKVLSVSLIFLAGCAANSGIVPTGPDSYFVSRQAATGLTGMGALKAEALGEAGQFCGAKSKKLQVISEIDAQPPFILGNFPKTEIKFTCV